MSKQHIWRIKKEYFRKLMSGEKTLEIRVGYAHVKNVRAGDTIHFENYGRNEFDVVRVTTYRDFSEMLNSESVAEVLPNLTETQALKTLQEIYPTDKERLGVYVFGLRRKT